MLTLILKATNACNLRCSYCCVGDKSATETLTQSAMSQALKWFAGEARQRNEPNPAIIFHGGEPLLIPVEQYRNCMDELTAQNPSIKFDFQIQTNGTILSPEIISMFRDYRMKPGISLDGSECVHNSQRMTADGRASYSTIMQNIRTLMAVGVRVSALMVLTRRALGESLDFLNDFAELGIPLKINPLYSAGEASKHDELFLDAGDYADYMIRVYEYIIAHDLDVTLLPIEYIMTAILGRTTPRGCTFSEACSDSFVCVNQEGNIYPCGRFADDKAEVIGDIWTGITPEGRETLGRLKAERIRKECRECEYLSLCNGGCPVMKGLMCEDYKKFLHYLYNDGLTMYKDYLVERREKLLSCMNSSC